MQITLQVNEALSTPLRVCDESNGDVRRILALLDASKASVEAMYSNTQDREMSRFFTVLVPDEAGPALQDALLKAQGVTAAYVAPPLALP